MDRNLALRIALVIIGVLFVALLYPAVVFVRQEPALSMMLMVYVTLGVFLLLAVREPVRSRSVVLFTAWSSIVHAGWMGAQALRGMVQHGEMIGCAVLLVIGIVLLALAPRRRSIVAEG